MLKTTKKEALLLPAGAVVVKYAEPLKLTVFELYVGLTPPDAFRPFPLLSLHVVTLLPLNVNVLSSAASSQS